MIRLVYYFCPFCGHSEYQFVMTDFVPIMKCPECNNRLVGKMR